MAVSDMQARLKAVIAEMDTIDARPSRSADEDTKYAALLVEGQNLKGQIEQSARGEELRAWAGQSAGMLSLTGGQNGGATVHGMRSAGDAQVEVKAFRSYLRLGQHRMTDSMGLKVLQEGLDPSGGFLVPEDIQNRVISKKPTPTRVAGRVQRITTSRDTVTFPRVVYSANNLYTSGMRVTWTGEVPASSTVHAVTDPVFGNWRINVFTAMMSLPLTRDQVEDTSFDLVGWCTSKFEETIALLRDNMALNGTGSGQPTGILANPNATDNPATTASGVADALSWSGLQDILWAVPEQYDENLCWCFNRTSTGLAIAKFVDGDGRPLWTNGAADNGMVGSPRQNTLLGYPVVYSGFMPDIAASAYPVIFGDLQGYLAVDRVGFSIEVLREILARENQILLLGRVRFGGLCIEPWRLRIQQVSA